MRISRAYWRCNCVVLLAERCWGRSIWGLGSGVSHPTRGGERVPLAAGYALSVKTYDLISLISLCQLLHLEAYLEGKWTTAYPSLRGHDLDGYVWVAR